MNIFKMLALAGVAAASLAIAGPAQGREIVVRSGGGGHGVHRDGSVWHGVYYRHRVHLKNGYGWRYYPVEYYWVDGYDSPYYPEGYWGEGIGWGYYADGYWGSFVGDYLDDTTYFSRYDPDLGQNGRLRRSIWRRHRHVSRG